MCPTQRAQRDFAHVSSNALTTNSSEAALMKNRFYNEQQKAGMIDERRDKNEKFGRHSSAVNRPIATSSGQRQKRADKFPTGQLIACPRSAAAAALLSVISGC